MPSSQKSLDPVETRFNCRMGSYGDSRNEIKWRMFPFIYAINDIRINRGKKILASDGIAAGLIIVFEGNAEIFEFKGATRMIIYFNRCTSLRRL